jgi:hypothetical protein
MGEVRRDARHEATPSLSGFEELGSLENAAAKQVEEIPVDRRTDRLHHIASHRVPRPLVGVLDAYAGVETHGEKRDPRLSLQTRVQV